MKRDNCVVAILAILTIFTSDLFAQLDPSKSISYQDHLENSMHEKNVPALGIGIIEDGVLRQIQVYGDLKFNTPAPYDAIFNVASLSKPITTLLILRLVSNGDWDLDEPLYHSEEVYEDMLRLQAMSKPNEGFGLGWYIKKNYNNGEYALMHSGSDAGVATKVILFPDSKRGIVIFTNGDNGFDVIERVEAEYFSSGN